MAGPPCRSEISPMDEAGITAATDSAFCSCSHFSTSDLMKRRRLPTRNDGGMGIPRLMRFLAVWSEILSILLTSVSVKVSMVYPKND